jgi:hypothetical protein
MTIAAFRIALTNLLKPIDTEWQTCLDNLQKNSRRVLALAQATDAVRTKENRKCEYSSIGNGLRYEVSFGYLTCHFALDC